MNVFARFLLAALLCGALPAAAQGYPSRPIRLIVPYAPGGNVDITARILSAELGKVLGQSVVVENRVGGGGSIGATQAAKAPPDGYTLLMGSSGPLAINPVAIPNVGYDPIKDFAPISRVHVVPLVVLSSAKAGVGSVKELIDRAKREPGKITVASAGTGTTNHLAIELFSVTAGVKFLHVPYKGGGPALSDLAAGHVVAAFEQLNSAMGFIRDGRAVALAVTSAKRSSALPGVATLEELGVKGYEVTTFVGVLAPTGTPKPIIAKLNGGVRKALESPSVSQKLREIGTEPRASSPEEFRHLIANELGKWRDLATKAGLKFE